MADLSPYLDPAGLISVDVQISSGPGSDLEPYKTAANGTPDAVARFLEELAADVRRTARSSTERKG